MKFIAVLFLLAILSVAFMQTWDYDEEDDNR